MLGDTVPLHAGMLAPDLAERIKDASFGQEFDILVRMRSVVNRSVLSASVKNLGRHARVAEVVRTLRSNAEQSQQDLKGYLDERAVAGTARRIRPFWIFNGFSLTATADVVQTLADRDDVDTVTLDRVLHLAPSPDASVGNPEPSGLTATPQATGAWNLDAIGAPTVWAQGFTGQGTVIASFDTGVDVSHPAVGPKWRGGAHDWFDPYRSTTVPYDASGHGTATMGILAGGDMTGNPVGVAPGAQWIAAKIFDDQGNAQTSLIHAAFAWVLDPDGNPANRDVPDVVNNSWDLNNPGGYDGEFAPDILALAAAGIEVVFSAGNSGPGTNTSTSPGNNPGAVSVGATMASDQIASFSSRGPSAFDGSFFPALAAPGWQVRSTSLAGNYGYNSGTSFSAPHVAGAYALLKSAVPALTLQQAEEALEKSVAGASGPDNVTGYGRLDVAKALSYLTLPGDVDGNGKIDLADVVIVLRSIMGSTPMTPLIAKNGNVSPLATGIAKSDGDLTIQDALFILQKAVGFDPF
ncbi:hypothetical protein AOG2_11370 [Geobacter sp. AOG2]|nr:hypothetical protein AOG2_11370 [Geobacter sp. AOG2]